jgi:hypothetical protein
VDVDCLKMLNIHSVNIADGGGLKSEWSCREIHAGGFSCIEEHKFQYTNSFFRRAQSFNLDLSILSGFHDSDSSSSCNLSNDCFNKSGVKNFQQTTTATMPISHSCSNIFSRHSSTSLEQNFHDQTLTPENNINNNNNKNKISLNDYVSLRAKSNSQLSSTSSTVTPSLVLANIKQQPPPQTVSNRSSPHTMVVAQQIDPIKQEPIEATAIAENSVVLAEHHAAAASPKNLSIKEEPQVLQESPKRALTNKKLPSLSLMDELKKRLNTKGNKENSYGHSLDEDDVDDNSDNETNESDDDKESIRKRRHSKTGKKKSKHRHRHRRHHHHTHKSSKKSNKTNSKSKKKNKKQTSKLLSDESDTHELSSRHHHRKRKKSNF